MMRETASECHDADPASLCHMDETEVHVGTPVLQRQCCRWMYLIYATHGTPVHTAIQCKKGMPSAGTMMSGFITPQASYIDDQTTISTKTGNYLSLIVFTTERTLHVSGIVVHQPTATIPHFPGKKEDDAASIDCSFLASHLPRPRNTTATCVPQQ